MLRIHFTAADLTRIRIRADPHPLWEVLLSLHLVQTRHGALTFGAWRRRARAALRPSGDILTVLAPPKGYSPDFLTPPVDSPDLEDGLEVLLGTGRQVLRDDMAKLAAQKALPGWGSRLAAGDAEVMRRLADRIRQYHATALQPYAQVFAAHVRADWARRAELAATHGLGHALSTLHPTIRWLAPVLEIDYPVEQDLALDGRGLVLVPSFFCWRTSMSFADPALRPTLLYPVDPVVGWMTAGRGPGGRGQSARDARSLVALLGRTRAAVLQTIADKPYLNTTELARAAGTSVAGASQHAAVLREAGLVITQRRDRSAVHTLSARGAVLLNRSEQAGVTEDLAQDVLGPPAVASGLPEDRAVRPSSPSAG